MNKWYYTTLAGLMLLAGILFAVWYKEIIIIRGSVRSYDASSAPESVVKKKVYLSFWRANEWAHETIELVVSADVADALSRLVNAWLTVLDEEGLLQKKVQVQAALLNDSGQEAYLSFDRNPFEKSASTYEKLMFVESLLKTVRDNGIPLKKIYFQVHYQPLQDYHLDFTNAWPLSGFVQ